MTKEHKDEEYVTKEDILDYTIYYALGNGYPSELAKGQRCAVQARLVVRNRKSSLKRK